MRGSVAALATLLGLLLANARSAFLVTANVATNEILESPVQEDFNLPPCRNGAACGYLQVNAFGVSSRQFCSCRGYEGGDRGGVAAGRCGMAWDPEDGRSVTMGSLQYKYCGSPPPLRVCDREEAAYTAAFLFHKATFSMSEQRHVLHCYCPPPLTHVHSDVEEDVVGSELVMATIYSCSRLPPCMEGTPCKEVSVGEGTAFVYPKCRCPRQTACPTLTSAATPHSNSFPKGAAYSVHCLPFY
ncbi:U-scoloptoxin(11)-Sm6a-like [Eriocheir sinensis]|uniref:U-scoloptoxin(11)-Sm6a-like n=1 Tax=Eriocheir sinensis TaxID=95602 RepID=UPI0021CA0B3C|nr:U-scoloptoxin(11)-Sm6a-like [Eriocheir sinensis]